MEFRGFGYLNPLVRIICCVFNRKMNACTIIIGLEKLQDFINLILIPFHIHVIVTLLSMLRTDQCCVLWLHQQKLLTPAHNAVKVLGSISV